MQFLVASFGLRDSNLERDFCCLITRIGIGGETVKACSVASLAISLEKICPILVISEQVLGGCFLVTPSRTPGYPVWCYHDQ